MMRFYKLTIGSVYDEENKEYTTYGIKAVNIFGKVIKSYTDIFFDKSKAKKFVKICNKGHLSLVHFEDVIEDILIEQYTL